MTKALAIALATFAPADYVAKKIRGQWCVWSIASDHVVEFDPSTIERVKREVETFQTYL